MDSSSVDNRLLGHAHKLITHSCENKKVLFEPKREAFPYHLRTAIRFNAAPTTEIEAYLNELLGAETTANTAGASAGTNAPASHVDSDNGSNTSSPAADRRKKYAGRDIVTESHKRFLKAAEKLRKHSNSVNESLFFVISTYDKNLAEEAGLTPSRTFDPSERNANNHRSGGSDEIETF